MAFVLDHRLQEDTLHVGNLALCELLMMNDCRYPWAILVPRLAGARELHDLDDDQQKAVYAEMMLVSGTIAKWESVEKVNIGALGNIVSQLHIHIIGRHTGDPAWPAPVWGHSPRVPYAVGEDASLRAHLRAIQS